MATDKNVYGESQLWNRFFFLGMYKITQKKMHEIKWNERQENVVLRGEIR